MVLFTSALRSEGGFFKASLKEVSVAPVIFITSARAHLRGTGTLSSGGFARFSFFFSSSLNKNHKKNLTSRWIQSEPSRAWMEFSPEHGASASRFSSRSRREVWNFLRVTGSWEQGASGVRRSTCRFGGNFQVGSSRQSHPGVEISPPAPPAPPAADWRRHLSARGVQAPPETAALQTSQWRLLFVSLMLSSEKYINLIWNFVLKIDEVK